MSERTQNNPMKPIKEFLCVALAAGLILVIIILLPGCGTFSLTTNGTVNTNNVIADAAVLQGLTTTGARLALADTKVGPQARVIMGDINLVIAGVLSGANTNSPTQIAALINGTAAQDAALAADIAPAVNFLSGLEQGAIARYGSANWAIIGTAFLKAVGAGITSALQ
jgi:hypothetical protein